MESAPLSGGRRITAALRMIDSLAVSVSSRSCVPELLPPVAEVNAYISNATKGFFFVQAVGIEKSRFLGRSGTQHIFACISWVRKFVILTEICKADDVACEIQSIPEPATGLLVSEFNRLMPLS